MTRSIDFSVDSHASVDEIYWAFSQEEYWRARMKAFGGMGKLDALDVRPDGSVSDGMIGRLMVPQFSVIQRFTAKWITQNS
ncbi:SRPBCC family protein [Mycolicibacterium psychrotolerans]|uniref:Polyketide cyclase n=1 Tax=Mycolicibacterium psychrotolerans TaxID=216929 RepID=A0A7I7MAK3_9MYCO|nr:hypothetical protein [Mycolicibacterium psychrotolerans]BBX69281.1 hypothetical protein MPSYJ_27420 [Mycolicibacterium psychrotolerans]